MGQLLLWFLLIAMTSCPPVTSSQAGPAVQPSFLGVSLLGITSGSNWPKITVGTLGKTQGTEWNDAEPSNGTFVWTALDNSLTLAQNAGVKNFIYTFWSTPKWASSEPNQSCILTPIEKQVTGCAAPPTNIGDWDTFVKALVTRYSSKIQYYELWNEANLAETYSGNISEMVTMAAHAYRDIKAIEPSAIILSPSSSTIGILPYTSGCNIAECWLAQYLKAGGGNYSDEIAFHSYAYFTSDAAAQSLGIACPQGEIDSCAGVPLVKQIEGIRSILSTYDLSGKPLVDTEGGIPGNIISPNLQGTAAQQSSFLSRWFVIQASENISTAVWFTEFFSADGLAGFGNSSSNAQMNLAYNTTYAWLTGSIFQNPCSLSPNSIWICNLTLTSGEGAQIVFANSTQQSTISYQPGASYFEYLDLNGSAHPIDGPLGVGMSPILLLTTNNNTSTSSSTTTTRSTASESQSTTLATSNSRPPSSFSLVSAILLTVVIVVAILLYAFVFRRRSRTSPHQSGPSSVTKPFFVDSKIINKTVVWGINLTAPR